MSTCTCVCDEILHYDALRVTDPPLSPLKAASWDLDLASIRKDAKALIVDVREVRGVTALLLQTCPSVSHLPSVRVCVCVAL